MGPSQRLRQHVGVFEFGPGRSPVSAVGRDSRVIESSGDVVGENRALSDNGIDEVVSRWDQLLRFAVLRLEQKLGSDVQMVLSRKDASDASLRAGALRNDLVQRGVLTGTIRIPGAVGDMTIEADLRTSRITTTVDIAAPADGRPLTRINWLLRQLQDAQDTVRIEAFAHMARTSMSELLKTVRADPTVLFTDPKAEIRRFRVSMWLNSAANEILAGVRSSTPCSHRSTGSMAQFCRPSASGFRGHHSFRSRGAPSRRPFSTLGSRRPR